MTIMGKCTYKDIRYEYITPHRIANTFGPDLDLDCLLINPLSISEEMLDAPQDNCCCFYYITVV